TTTASTPNPAALPIHVERQPRVAPTPTTMVTISIASTPAARKVAIRTAIGPVAVTSVLPPSHEGHELGRHHDERPHHVVVFMLEDVAVVHVSPGESVEADEDVDDLVRVHAHSVLEAQLVC